LKGNTTGVTPQISGFVTPSCCPFGSAVFGIIFAHESNGAVIWFGGGSSRVCRRTLQAFSFSMRAKNHFI